VTLTLTKRKNEESEATRRRVQSRAVINQRSESNQRAEMENSVSQRGSARELDELRIQTETPERRLQREIIRDYEKTDKR
jgi:hypothetical protein